MTILDEPPATENGQPPADARDEGWKKNKHGKLYVTARGRPGTLFREGSESVEEAYARDDRGPRDKRPKPRPRGKPPAPTSVSLKELEWELAEGLKAPAMLCAAFGDEWPANHLTREGPLLARNLVKAAEHNPWLRAKLEAATRGEDIMVRLITAMGLAGALFAYAVPVALYYTNPGFVPKEARTMFGVPDRNAVREEERLAQATEAAAAAAAATAPAAAAA